MADNFENNKARFVEIVMYLCFMEIEKMDYLNPFQSGIRSGHGAEMTLIVLVDYSHWDFDMGSTSLLVLLVAFDAINHDILLDQLEAVEIENMVLQ